VGRTEAVQASRRESSNDKGRNLPGWTLINRHSDVQRRTGRVTADGFSSASTLTRWLRLSGFLDRCLVIPASAADIEVCALGERVMPFCGLLACGEGGAAAGGELIDPGGALIQIFIHRKSPSVGDASTHAAPDSFVSDD
jgi:hypothetical protein